MRVITGVDELRDLVGEPGDAAAHKVRDRLHPRAQEFARQAPLWFVATSDASGRCDVSPKGDLPGCGVLVPDERTVVLAERPGNRRVDGWHNVLANPHVGLLFVIPGRGDTLRVNGRARLLQGSDYDAALTVRGRPPVLVCEIAVEEVFFHCSKAFLRSRAWSPESWDPESVPDRAHIAHAMERSDQTLQEVQDYYASPSYGAELW